MEIHFNVESLASFKCDHFLLYVKQFKALNHFAKLGNTHSFLYKQYSLFTLSKIVSRLIGLSFS